MTVQPGDIIKVTHVQEETAWDDLYRTASTYGYGMELELKPRTDTEYVVCNGDEINGYTVMDMNNKEIPQGYVITSNAYRISQVGFEWKSLTFNVTGKYDGGVPDITPIGSHVFVLSV